MPFPGIAAGSADERKIDRCVERVMATGRDKSTAIAICRSSVVGEKSRGDAVREARYRDAGPASTQICSTCKFGANEFKNCSLFEFTYNNDWTCDRWLPNIDATRTRLQTLQAENAKRLAQRKEWIIEAKFRIMLNSGDDGLDEPDEIAVENDEEDDIYA